MLCLLSSSWCRLKYPLGSSDLDSRTCHFWVIWAAHNYIFLNPPLLSCLSSFLSVSLSSSLHAFLPSCLLAFPSFFLSSSFSVFFKYSDNQWKTTQCAFSYFGNSYKTFCVDKFANTTLFQEPLDKKNTGNLTTAGRKNISFPRNIGYIGTRGQVWNHSHTNDKDWLNKLSLYIFVHIHKHYTCYMHVCNKDNQMKKILTLERMGFEGEF